MWHPDLGRITRAHLTWTALDSPGVVPIVLSTYDDPC